MTEDTALSYLRSRQDAISSIEEATWLRADRFFRAAQVLLGVDGERLSQLGIQQANLLAILLLETVGPEVKP